LIELSAHEFGQQWHRFHRPLMLGYQSFQFGRTLQHHLKGLMVMGCLQG
tara:strand:+ start:498 stop:644 length:147 start_codon:yes stop_codon:yes gene_type:complete